MKKILKYSLILVTLVVSSCVEDRDHDVIELKTRAFDVENRTKITFSEFDDATYKGENDVFIENVYIEGYVISSDRDGSYFRELYIQNTFDGEDISVGNPRLGLKINIVATDLYTKYPIGRKVQIDLSGLKGGFSKGIRILGKPGIFGFIDPIELSELDAVIYETNETKTIAPKVLDISDLTTNDVGTWIQFKDVHFQEDEHTKSFANETPEAFDEYRTIEACDICNSQIELETSNFADFSQIPVPTNQFDISGIYTFSFDQDPVLVINNADDIAETTAFERCRILENPNILITEVADPSNSDNARYVELYNAEDTDFCLNGWSLVWYDVVNAGKDNQRVDTKTIQMDNVIIKAKSYIIIANASDSEENKPNFFDVFGQQADILSANLNGNGIEAYRLLNKANQVVDAFGAPDTADFNAIDWNYTDSRVYRNLDINSPTSTFDRQQWTIETNAVVPGKFNPNSRDEVVLQPISDKVFINEIADPSDSGKTGARFVELYNSGDSAVDLTNWTLQLIENGDKVRNIDLSGLVVPSKSTVVIANKKDVFESSYGVVADLYDMNIRSTGNDAYHLVDANGLSVDIYGALSYDINAIDWGYTDRRVLRKNSITQANSSFDLNEWEISANKIKTTDNVYTPGVK